MARRITATEAARRFADVLDRVEHRRDEYVIERRGRPVARLSPAGRAVRSTVADLRRIFDELGPLDPGFARDVRAARKTLNRPPKDPWASSSTRRS